MQNLTGNFKSARLCMSRGDDPLPLVVRFMLNGLGTHHRHLHGARCFSAYLSVLSTSQSFQEVIPTCYADLPRGECLHFQFVKVTGDKASFVFRGTNRDTPFNSRMVQSTTGAAGIRLIDVPRTFKIGAREYAAKVLLLKVNVDLPRDLAADDELARTSASGPKPRTSPEYAVLCCTGKVTWELFYRQGPKTINLSTDPEALRHYELELIMYCPSIYDLPIHTHAILGQGAFTDAASAAATEMQRWSSERYDPHNRSMSSRFKREDADARRREDTMHFQECFRQSRNCPVTPRRQGFRYECGSDDHLLVLHPARSTPSKMLQELTLVQHLVVVDPNPHSLRATHAQAVADGLHDVHVMYVQDHLPTMKVPTTVVRGSQVTPVKFRAVYGEAILHCLSSEVITSTLIKLRDAGVQYALFKEPVTPTMENDQA